MCCSIYITIPFVLKTLFRRCSPALLLLRAVRWYNALLFGFWKYDGRFWPGCTKHLLPIDIASNIVPWHPPSMFVMHSWVLTTKSYPMGIRDLRDTVRITHVHSRGSLRTKPGCKLTQPTNNSLIQQNHIQL